MEARGPVVVINIIGCCKYESVNSKQLENILLIFSFLSSNYYYLGRHIDIKSIKLFDCLQCLSFPSMRENDNWID